jgi:nucleoside-diphosphate-sugar epimerase
MYGLSVVLTRVGSAYGEQMRSDELIAKLVIHSILGKGKFYLRSPRARRLWTHIDDVLSFYRCLLNELDSQIGETLHCAGNLGDRILENAEIAKMIVKTTGTRMEIVEGEYEPGETVFGTPVHFSNDSNRTRKVLSWKPCISLGIGIKRTVDWFKTNIWRFT